jgi:hypothetical protein
MSDTKYVKDMFDMQHVNQIEVEDIIENAINASIRKLFGLPGDRAGVRHTKQQFVEHSANYINKEAHCN